MTAQKGTWLVTGMYKIRISIRIRNIMNMILRYLFSVLPKVNILVSAIHHAANTSFHLTFHSTFITYLSIRR